MHASPEQLLSLRDGDDADDTVRSHLTGCGECAAELDRLTGMRDALAALPVIPAPPDRWSAIVDRAGRSAPRRRAATMAAAGIAAAITVAVVVAQLDAGTGVDDAARPGLATASDPVRPAPRAVQAATPVASPELLRAESRRLENLLRSYRTFRPEMSDPSLADAVRSLEAQVAAVDYGLTHADELPLSSTQADALWQQRVDLMESIVQIRGAELRRVEYRSGLR